MTPDNNAQFLVAYLLSYCETGLENIEKGDSMGLDVDLMFAYGVMGIGTALLISIDKKVNVFYEGQYIIDQERVKGLINRAAQDIISLRNQVFTQSILQQIGSMPSGLVN